MMYHDYNDTERAMALIMFNEYNKASGGLTYDEKPIPPWSDIPDNIKARWCAVARKVFFTLEVEAESEVISRE